VVRTPARVALEVNAVKSGNANCTTISRPLRRKKAPQAYVVLSGGATAAKEVFRMKILIKRVEAIKATRIHLDPDAGGA